MQTRYRLRFEFDSNRVFQGSDLNKIFFGHEFVVDETEFARMLSEAGLCPGVSLSISTEEVRRHATPLGRD